MGLELPSLGRMEIVILRRRWKLPEEGANYKNPIGGFRRLRRRRARNFRPRFEVQNEQREEKFNHSAASLSSRWKEK